MCGQEDFRTHAPLSVMTWLAILLLPPLPSGRLILAFGGFVGGRVAFRIHLTRDDLLRVSLGEGADPVFETVISLRAVQRRRPGAAFGPWQRWARQQIPRSVQLLRSLVPPHEPCPDFLTPLNATDLDAGLDALLYTPKSTLHSELEEFTHVTGKPLAWASSLADGSPRALETVSHAIHDWHRTAIAPMQQHLHARTEATRLSAARTLLAEGLDAMLSRLHPTIRWTPPYSNSPVPTSTRTSTWKGVDYA